MTGRDGCYNSEVSIAEEEVENRAGREGPNEGKRDSEGVKWATERGNRREMVEIGCCVRDRLGWRN
jgi:hypothetical protein